MEGQRHMVTMEQESYCRMVEELRLTKEKYVLCGLKSSIDILYIRSDVHVR